MSEPIITERGGGFATPARIYRGRTFYPLERDALPVSCVCGQPLRLFTAQVAGDEDPATSTDFRAVSQDDLTAYVTGHNPAHDIVVEDPDEPVLVAGDCRTVVNPWQIFTT